MNTERLHDQIEDCDKEMKRIENDAADLLKAVESLVSDFAVKYPHADEGGLTEDFATRLADVVNDLQGPAWRRKCRIEDEIGRIDDADLWRNQPGL